MMMGLLSDKCSLSILPEKRLLEHSEHEARKFPPNFKRPKVDAIRDFPRNCGALAHQVHETCTRDSRTRVQPATENLEVASQSNKLIVEHVVELEPVELKMEAIKPPLLVSNDDDTEPTIKIPLKDVEMGSPIASRKVDLEKVGGNDSTPNQIDTIDFSETPSKPQMILRKYPSPKIRKGVAVFRDFPQGCGRLNHDSSNKSEVLPNGNSGVERRHLVETIHTDNAQIGAEWLDKDHTFSRKIEQKILENIYDEVKAETGKATKVKKDKMFEEITSSECLDQKDDIENIGITSSSLSNLLQTTLECRMACNNDSGGARSQIGRMEEDSGKCIITCRLPDEKTDLMMHSERIVSVDLATSFHRGIVTGMQQVEKVFDCVSTESTGGFIDQKYEIMGADESKYLILKQDRTNVSKQNALTESAGSIDQKYEIMGDGKSKYLILKQDKINVSEQNFANEESLILGMKSGKRSDYGGTIGDTLAAKESTDLSSVSSDSHQAALSCNKVRDTLNLFEEILEKRIEEQAKSNSKGKVSSYIYVEIAMQLKEQKKWINMNERVLGAVPGVEIGDQFHSRAQLVIIGLHGQFVAGIDFMEKDGNKIATSIVTSDRYSNEREITDVLIYSGEGGNSRVVGHEPKDQTLVRGNLALKNSMDAGTPVRVIRGREISKKYKTRDKKGRKEAKYTYDGLYVVRKYWQDIGKHGNLVLMFQLNKVQGQPKLSPDMLNRSGKSKAPRKDPILLDDISYGKEMIPIRVANTIDNEKPPSFKYITNMVYPELHGSSISCCDCIHGCSDRVKCSCVIKNRGTVPFNDDGAIVRIKRIVYECGPSCKCPPSCKNRVSQHGLQFPLEVFKTNSRGWGVRSRDSILSGRFVCEYVGELLNDEQAEERSDYDEYLFDIGIGTTYLGCDDGFAIDAAHFGNVGRFVNHSCSPNLYAQDVLFDHGDKRLPHVMLFATMNIPPLQELTYDYNYKIDQVRDSSGNIKKKTCFCGAHDCCGRMY